MSDDRNGATIWITGLSGAGKSTLAAALERRLIDAGRANYVLDGDVLRTGLNADLGYDSEDRVENVRRVGEVAKLFSAAGWIVLCSLISPFREGRDGARKAHESFDLPFIEVFMDTPLGECELRDPKGLYKRARAGLLPQFTGIDSTYEPPQNPEVHLSPTDGTPAQMAEIVLAKLAAIQSTWNVAPSIGD